MIIHHIDMVILDIGMGYGTSMWEIIISILSPWISNSNILSLWTLHPGSLPVISPTIVNPGIPQYYANMVPGQYKDYYPETVQYCVPP
jgi:hypothetical protein